MDIKIEVEALEKRFGHLIAVNGVSFSVRQGEVLGFLGPNGAGKSTTMKMITGFLEPSAGRISVCGHDVMDEPIQAKSLIGYLPEGAPAYPEMTPRKFFDFVASARGLSGAKRRQAVEKAVTAVHLEAVMEQPIETLSKGFKRRVGLAQAILHDPPVLILDEPTDGLDPNQKHQVRDLIAGMAAEKVIIISTHILEEVDAVCSRAMIIASGSILFDGTPQELRARSDRHNAVVLKTAADGAKQALSQLVGVRSVEDDGQGRYVILPTGGQPIIKSVGDLTLQHKWPVDELGIETGRLDEVFRRITTQKSPDLPNSTLAGEAA
jgi:ABC-2 type transport system ATP-binding protein